MTMAPLIEKNPCKTRQFTNFILKMADLPEIQVFNNILEAVHYHKDAFRFELATYKATTKSIQKLEESKKREFEENKKQEEKLAWLKSRNNELANTSKGLETAMRSTESKKHELKTHLLKLQAQNEKRFKAMDKNVQLYKNKWENMYNIYESSPLAVKKQKLKNQVKNLKLKLNISQDKLKSLKTSISKYKAMNKKRLQILIVKFAQSMVDSSKNEETIMNLQNNINKLKQENESIISETKSISLLIEDFQKQKDDSLKEKLLVVRKENSAKVAVLGFCLPSLSFDQQSVPLLELPKTQTQNTNYTNIYNEPDLDNNILSKYNIDYINTNINKNMNNTENIHKEMTKETLNMEIDNTDQVHNENLFVEVAKEKEKKFSVGKNFDESEKDVNKRNAPKVNILSNVQLNKEQTEKIFESYIRKIPSLNQNSGYVFGNYAPEINMKNDELFKNINEDKNNEFPEEKYSNVFDNINPDNKAIEKTNKENETNRFCLENKSESPETPKSNPLHQECIYVAKENVHNDSVIELKPSRSKYFEENNFNEASPSKIGFAHSTPINRKQNINFGQHSIVETQPETTSFNKNDLHATKLTIPNEPMQCENIQERPMEISPTETSNFKTYSTQQSPSIYIKGQKLEDDQIMALLRYGTDTQQSEDTYPNYREFMRMANSCVVSPKDDCCVDFKINEAKDKIEPCPKIEFANAGGGFFDIFKKNTIAASTAATATATTATATTATTANVAPITNESTPTFNFNFNNQEKKKKTFFNFFS